MFRQLKEFYRRKFGYDTDDYIIYDGIKRLNLIKYDIFKHAELIPLSDSERYLLSNGGYKLYLITIKYIKNNRIKLYTNHTAFSIFIKKILMSDNFLVFFRTLSSTHKEFPTKKLLLTENMEIIVV